MSDVPSDDVQDLLKQVLDEFDKEDSGTREAQILKWRKLKMYWDGIHNFYYSEVAHDWRVYDQRISAEDDTADYYDKPVNIFRAYLESIIAALSVTIPTIKCKPDDAENAMDISTAKAGDRIAELVYKHNDVTLLFIHALYIFATEGMVAAYNRSVKDKKYGTYKENTYEDETQENYFCPECQAKLTEDIFNIAGAESNPDAIDPMTGQPMAPPELSTTIEDAELYSSQQRDDFGPGPNEVELDNLLNNESGTVCPECGAQLDPSMEKTPFVVTRLVGQIEKPKARQCIEVFGGLFVKVPNYARSQEECPYLIYSFEEHYTSAIERYPHIRDKFSDKSKSLQSSMGSHDSYERWGRLPPQYNGTYPDNIVTCRNIWFRPGAFNVLNEDEAKRLKKLYPDGCYCVFVNDLFAAASNESLDDSWTLTRNPLADYLQHDPLGLMLVSVQDITNDLVSLVVQTIEHGIPQTFADPAVLNFEQYRQTEVTPGAIFPTKTISSSKSVADGFYEIKTATLSGEVLPFIQKIQEFGQLVSGALPSLFGGDIQGSKTASQYSMSRAQALQRLQTQWKMLTIWWKDIFGKVIPSYIKDVADDEKYVGKDTYGNYINIFVRKAELQGKIGDIELEASEQLPITWSQQRDVLMQLLQGGNPLVMEALTAPENLHQLAQAIGLSGFVVPGEADRHKQYEEIQQLLQSVPISDPMNVDPMTGQPMEQPAVPIDNAIDDNQIEYDICRSWLISEAGRLAKVDNPAGYMNVLLHAKAHMDAMVQGMMQQQMMGMQQGPESNGGGPAMSPGQQQPKPKNQNATAKPPNAGMNDGRTVQ